MAETEFSKELDSLKKDLASLKEGLAKLAEGLKAELMERKEVVKGRIKAGAEVAEAEAKELLGQLQESLKRLEGELKERPLLTGALLFAAGLLLGRLLKR